MDEAMTSRAVAQDQDLPAGFLSAILNDLRRAGLVTNQRGPDGGYRLGRPADAITVADVMRVLDGPLARVRGQRPEATDYGGSAKHLQEVWIAVRANLRSVLEHVTLYDVVHGRLSVTERDLPESATLRALPG